MTKEKIKNGIIFTIKEPLTKLLKESFPVSVSVKLITLAKIITESYQIIEEARMGLVKKYGETNEKGGIELIPPNDPDKRPMSPNWLLFVSEVNELFAAETEIDFEKVIIPKQVTIRCDKCQHVIKKELEISADTLIALEQFIQVGD